MDSSCGLEMLQGWTKRLNFTSRNDLIEQLKAEDVLRIGFRDSSIYEGNGCVYDEKDINQITDKDIQLITQEREVHSTSTNLVVMSIKG